MANVNKAGQTHDQLQAACWKWACQTYHPYVYGRLIAIPNDACGENEARARHYQALGVTPGVWDMVLFWVDTLEAPDGQYGLPKIFPAVFWWEFKVGTDKLTETRIIKGKKKRGQTEHRATLEPFGHKFFVATEEDEFQEQFNSIVQPTLQFIKEINKGE